MRDRSTSCRIWRGSKRPNGYGRVWIAGRTVSIHRHVVERAGQDAVGTPWSPDLLVLHRCDTRDCFRFDHLYLGTQADNMADRRKRQRYVGAQVYNAKLTEAEVRDIRRRHAAGEPGASIAADYGITPANVSRVALRQSWRHVNA